MEGFDQIIRDSMMEKLKEEIGIMEGNEGLGRLKRVMKEWRDGLGDDAERALDIPLKNIYASHICNGWEDCEDWKQEYNESIRGLLGCVCEE